MQRISDHQSHAGEARIQPVDRGLALLEVVQIDPASLHTVWPEHWRGGTPVGVLDTGLVEDHSLHPPDDIAVFGQLIFCLDVEIDRIASGDDGQQVPVLGFDLDHVVDAWVVANVHLGQPEIGALAGVARHDVVDHHSEMARGYLRYRTELLLGSECLVDRVTDPVEVPIHAGGVIPADEAASPLDGASVYAVNADSLEGSPQILITQGSQE